MLFVFLACPLWHLVCSWQRFSVLWGKTRKKSKNLIKYWANKGKIRHKENCNPTHSFPRPLVSVANLKSDGYALPLFFSQKRRVLIVFWLNNWNSLLNSNRFVHKICWSRTLSPFGTDSDNALAVQKLRTSDTSSSSATNYNSVSHA